MNITPEVQAALDDFAAMSKWHAEIVEWTRRLIKAHEESLIKPDPTPRLPPVDLDDGFGF